MKKAQQEDSSKPRSLSIPTSGTDQELHDALEMAIDAKTAYILRRQARQRREEDEHRHEQEAFVKAFLPPILKWLTGRESFHESELKQFLQSLGGESLALLVMSLKGCATSILIIEDRSDFPAHTYTFNIQTNFEMGGKRKDPLLQRVARTEPLVAPGWCPRLEHTWLES